MSETYLINQGYLKTVKNDYLSPAFIFESPFWVDTKEPEPFHIQTKLTKQFAHPRSPDHTLELTFTRNEYPPLKEERKIRYCCPPNDWELTVVHKQRGNVTFELDMVLCRDDKIIDFAQIEYAFITMFNGLKSFNMSQNS